MPEKIDNLPYRRQAFLVLLTLQLILNSSNKVNELGQIIKSETEKQMPPQGTEAQESQKEKLENKPQEIRQPQREEDRMIKSVLSQSPPPSAKSHEDVRAVKPVRIKTPRMEMSSVPLRSPQRVLRMPEPRLPAEFQYLRPTPTEKEIDLGNLNPLIYDPAVRTIECVGPEKPIMVMGAMGKKPTEIKMTNQEVEEIIKKFSSASKIPAETGVYKVVVGRLIFSAVISDVVPSRFIIRKMRLANPATPVFGPPNPNYRLFFRKQ